MGGMCAVSFGLPQRCQYQTSFHFGDRQTNQILGGSQIRREIVHVDRFLSPLRLLYFQTTSLAWIGMVNAFLTEGRKHIHE